MPLFDPERRSDPYDPRDLRHCSHSILRRFRESIPWFHAVHIAKTVELDDPTKEMRIGSACDTLLLEPDKADDKLICRDFGRTMSDRIEKKKLLAKCSAERIAWVTQEDFDTASNMAATARRYHRLDRLMSAKFEAQKVVKWNCPFTDYPCKGVLDYISEELGVIFDLKTCSRYDIQPQRIASHAHNSLVHCQLAMYQLAMEIETGRRYAMKVVFISREPPHEVAVLDVDGDELSLGHQENRITLLELRDCDEYDSWVSRREAEPQTLRFSRWHLNKLIETVDDDA